MAEEEVVEQLQSFDLDANEAEVYLFLVRAGTSTVSVIARRFSTNRMGIYRILKTLEEKGLVESTVGRPLRFVALPVVSFLNRYIQESKTKTSSLEKSREEIVKRCEQLQRAESLTEEPKFRIVQGRKHIHDQIFKMLETAKTETRIVQTRNGLYRFIYSGIDDKLKELHDKGIDVMVLTEVDESGVEAVKNYLTFAQVRHLAVPSTMRLVVVDETEALMTFARDDSMSLTTEKELAMWVKAPEYAKSMKLYFEALWKESVLARQRLAAIAAKQTLRETLGWARRTLEADGWTTMIPGKLIGESAVEHSFDLVARYPDEREIILVVDSLSEHSSAQILAFRLKALDVAPTIQLLVTNRPPSDETLKLASHHGIKLIHATQSQQLAVKIAKEANKFLKPRT